LEAVSTACPPASLRTYLTTIRRLATSFGADRVDAVGTADLERLSAHIRDQALARGHTDGTGAARGFIHGSRFWYRTAQRHDLRADNPAMSLVKPARRLRPRRALTGAELADLWVVVGSSGQDPLLDLLLIDFHRDTAARRCGAIALRIQDIDRQRESVLLRERGCHQRETPLSVDVIDRALVLASERGPLRPGDALFKFRDGSPLSRRRYNSIFDRVQGRLPWAAHLGVSIHWLRHTTLTDISNAAGPRIAAAYAGHLDRSVTDAYTVPSFEDLKTAHDAVFNG
jgi:site-specific recombinase XerD